MRRLRAKKKVQAEEQVDQDEAEVGPSESIEVEGEDKEDKQEEEECKGEDDDLCNAIAESFNEEADSVELNEEEDNEDEEHDQQEEEKNQEKNIESNDQEKEVEHEDQVKEVEEDVQMEVEDVQMEIEEIPETVQSEVTTSANDVQVSDDDTAAMEKNLADIFSVPEEVDGEDEEDDDDVLVCHTEDETLEGLNKEETVNKLSEPMKEEVLLDPAEVKDLLKCQVCSEVCGRGVSTPCCGAQACRACATKKLISSKECWDCKKTLKTDLLINDEPLRKAVVLFKANEKIPQSIVNKIKTRAAEKCVTVELGQVELQPLQSNFETGNTKIYLAVVVLKSINSSVALQIGCLNSRTGESLHIVFGPPKSIANKPHTFLEALHYRNFEKPIKFLKEDGSEKGCLSLTDGLANLLSFLQKAGPKLSLVMYTERERAQLVAAGRSCKELIKLATSSAVLESMLKSSGDMFRYMQIKEQIYSADRLAGLLREVVEKKKIKLEDVKFKPINEGGNAGGKINIPKDTFLLFSNLKLSETQIKDSSKNEEKSAKKSDPKLTTATTPKQKGNKPVEGNVGQVAHFTGLFNFVTPVLVKVEGAEDNSNIKYEKEYNGYKAYNTSKVFKVKDSLYTFVVLQPESPKLNIPGYFKFYKDIKSLGKLKTGTSLIKFEKVPGKVAPDTRHVSCSLMFRGPEKTQQKELRLDTKNAHGVNIAVSIKPVKGGGAIKFLKKGDIFALTKTVISSVKVINQLFCIDEDDANEARIVLQVDGPVTIPYGAKIGEAVLITEKNAELGVDTSAAQVANALKMLKDKDDRIRRKRGSKTKNAGVTVRNTLNQKETEKIKPVTDLRKRLIEKRRDKYPAKKPRMEGTVGKEKIWQDRSREILSAFGREEPRGIVYGREVPRGTAYGLEEPRGTAYGLGDRRGSSYGREVPRGSGYSRGDPRESRNSRGDSRVIGPDIRPNPVVVNQLVGAILNAARGGHQNRQLHDVYPAGQSRYVDPAGQSRSGMDWMRSIPTEEVVLGRSPFILNQGPDSRERPYSVRPTNPFGSQIMGAFSSAEDGYRRPSYEEAQRSSNIDNYERGRCRTADIGYDRRSRY